MSPALLGKQIEGIWHTGIVVFDREYYFGGGICSDPPGQTPYGSPQSVEQLGTTEKTQDEFLVFLSSVSSQFSMNSYHLLDNNCNNFSDACTRFLLGRSIPQYILDLPAEAMNSPLGPMIRPIIEQMQSVIQQQSVGHEVSLSPGPEAQSDRGTPSASPALPSTSQAAPVSLTVSEPYWSAPITLEKADRKAVTSKLKQYAPSYDGNSEGLIALSLSMSPEKSFPALDLLRLSVADSPGIAEHFTSEIRTLADRFILNEDAPAPACMMALRGAVNCFKHPKSSVRMCDSDIADIVVESIAAALTREKPQTRKTAALLALNLSGAHRRNRSAQKLDEDHAVRLLFAIVERLNSSERPAAEEARPLLSTLVVMVDGDADAVMLVGTFGLALTHYVEASSSSDAGVRTAAAQLEKLLSSG